MVLKNIHCIYEHLYERVEFFAQLFIETTERKIGRRRAQKRLYLHIFVEFPNK